MQRRETIIWDKRYSCICIWMNWRFSVGECIRKKFDGLWYDGKVISINLNTNVYYVRNTNKNKEDMTVADTQRYWVAKEVNQKKRGIKK